MAEITLYIVEISNNPKGLIYKISFENSEFFCAFSDSRFWIRENSASKSSDVDDFLFRINLDPASNIDLYIRKLSIIDSKKLIKPTPIFLPKHQYISEYFMPKNRENCFMFHKNDLLLFVIDKVLDISFDDSLQSSNSRILLDKFRGCQLGNYLLLRLIFYKYSFKDFAKNRIWEKSPVLKLWFIEFFDLLVKNDLEKYYPSENIALGLTKWFVPPEQDILKFLDFAQKWDFRFNE